MLCTDQQARSVSIPRLPIISTHPLPKHIGFQQPLILTASKHQNTLCANNNASALPSIHFLPLARTTRVSAHTLLGPAHLVPHTDQVVGQLLDRVGRGTGLHGLGVVGDEDGLLGFDDNDAFTALQ